MHFKKLIPIDSITFEATKFFLDRPPFNLESVIVIKMV